MKETATVPKGVYDGVTLRMAGKGNSSLLSGQSGDLLLKIVVRPHPYFKRSGQNIMTDKYITVTQAILGGTVKVQTLSNIVDVVVKPGTNDGTQHIL